MRGCLQQSLDVHQIPKDIVCDVVAFQIHFSQFSVCLGLQRFDLFTTLPHACAERAIELVSAIIVKKDAIDAPILAIIDGAFVENTAILEPISKLSVNWFLR